MLRLRVRLRPVEALSDLDPLAADILLREVEGVRDLRVWDERVSDALYLTIFLLVDGLDAKLRSDLENCLVRLPRMTAFVVDGKGDETPVTSADIGDWESATDPA